mmetsp:Transcript_8559/g.12778  ORF Transcript_8559/g.12778 Transcript_8559/m.12778 type:complete len:141 (+) Transcript_8559:95-517(+)
MEDIKKKFKEYKDDVQQVLSDYEHNGTPLRGLFSKGRTSIEGLYNDTSHHVSSFKSSFTSQIVPVESKIQDFYHKNSSIADYCRVHPAVVVGCASSVVALPSLYFFGIRGMALGALGAASVSSLAVGALQYEYSHEKKQE